MVAKCPQSYPLMGNSSLNLKCEWISEDSRVYNNSVWYKNEYCQGCWMDEQDSAIIQKLKVLSP